MITSSARPRLTRDRLIDAGLRLFATNGFRATTVGQIESEAGLQPRRGALYRHFASKESLLEAAVSGHLEMIREGLDDIRQLPAGDVHDEAVALGQFVLDQLVAERAIVDVFEHEGERIAELRDMFRERISDPSYRNMAVVLRHWLGPEAVDKVDAAALEAAALLLLGALVNVHRSTWTFGAAPLGIAEDQLLAAWADQCLAVIESFRHQDG